MAPKRLYISSAIRGNLLTTLSLDKQPLRNVTRFCNKANLIVIIQTTYVVRPMIQSDSKGD